MARVSSKVSAPPARPKGSETPRVWTKPLRKLTPKTSLGYRFIEFCETVLDWHPLPWQRWWSIHALELLGPFGDHNLRFRKILTLVGRQCGKTTLLKALALFMMYDGHARMILGAAQSLDIAREAWAAAVDHAESDPELKAEIDFVRRTNGEQCLTLDNKSRYRITAASRSAGRGLTVDLLIWDEIREQRDWLAWAALSKTTSARPNGLIIAISNAGDDASVVLNQLQQSSSVALDDPTTTTAIFDWSAPDGCAIDDWEAIAQGSPALGYTLSYDSVADSLRSDPPAIFRTEVMCQKVESLDTPISPLVWEACADPTGSHVMEAKDKHFCLDVAPDGEHATLAAATIGEDGRVRVGVVAAWSDIGHVRQDLPGILTEHKPKSLGWFPGGPAAALMADLLTIRGTKRVPLKGEDVPSSCQGFAEQTNSRQLIHGNDPLLTAHVIGSRRKAVGDGWRFQRFGGNADAAYAAAGAVHLVRTMPKPVKLKLHTSKVS